MKPIIGIISRVEFDNKHNISYTYTYESIRRMIIDMNGIPIILTPVINADLYETHINEYNHTKEEDKTIDKYLEIVDGIFIPGGSKYTGFDVRIFEKAVKKNIPILGVCLGAQVLSNYKRETKLEKINSSVNHNSNEKYAHSITINKNSILYKIVHKDKIMVNSMHNMKMISNSYFMNGAYSKDHIIEEIEMKGKDFIVGVQWHPEKMYKYDLDNKKILTYFVKKCASYSKKKGQKVYE